MSKCKECSQELPEKKQTKIEIKTVGGSVLFTSTKTTLKEAVEEAVESGADLSDADLSGAKFYGKGGKTKINKDQVNYFLTALGVVVK